MRNLHLKGNKISLMRKIEDFQEYEEEDQDIVKINLNSNIIQVNFSQLCKYSKLIREEYVISDVEKRLPEELLQFQQENRINEFNIKEFFKLFQEEEIIMTNDKYKDFTKLSQFFKIKKIQNQLKLYFNTHINDVDFIIKTFLDEIELQNQFLTDKNTNNEIEYKFKKQMEEFLIDNINKSIENKHFHELPTSLIYHIIEHSEQSDLSSELIFKLIKRSPTKLFALFKFIKIENLSDETFDELFKICEKQFGDENNINYSEYLSCDLKYIKNIRMENKKLHQINKEKEEENKKLNKKHSQLITEIDEVRRNKKQLLLEIDELKRKLNEQERLNKSLYEENRAMEITKKQIKEENLRQQAQIEETKEEQIAYEKQIKKMKLNIEQIKSNYNNTLELKQQIEINNKEYLKIIEQLKKEKKELQNKYDQNESIFSKELFSTALNLIFGDSKEINMKRATFILSRLSDNGIYYASYILGLLYMNGKDDILKDNEKSIYYLERSSEQGNPYGLVRIGNYYLDRDNLKAIEFYKKASGLCSSVALNNLGFCYDNGKGFKQDELKAFEYYQKASLNDCPVGLYNLGNSYYNGKIIKKDCTKAIEYLNKASDFGDACALKKLGDCYYYSNGVEQDLSKALEYYQKAFEFGNHRALEMIKKIKKKAS